MLDKRNACHRRHLRYITGHCWPKSLITNQALYELCNEEPLSSKVAKQRWSMLGHILRMDPDTPAQRALDFAVTGSQAYQARQGRHCTNILGTIRADLKQAGLGPLHTARQLHCLRQRAHDKARWPRTNAIEGLIAAAGCHSTTTAAAYSFYIGLYRIGFIPGAYPGFSERGAEIRQRS